jgi:hypothetical protein
MAAEFLDGQRGEAGATRMPTQVGEEEMKMKESE